MFALEGTASGRSEIITKRTGHKVGQNLLAVSLIRLTVISRLGEVQNHGVNKEMLSPLRLWHSGLTPSYRWALFFLSHGDGLSFLFWIPLISLAGILIGKVVNQ